MLYAVWKDSEVVEIRHDRKGLMTSVICSDADDLMEHLASLERRLGTEGSFDAKQKYLSRYVS